MTLAQWVFHYRECIRAEQKRMKEQDMVLDRIELYNLYSHPKTNLRNILQGIEQRRLQKSAPDIQKELEADYELAKQILPESLSIVLDEDEDKPKPVLPLTRKKKRTKNRLKKKDL